MQLQYPGRVVAWGDRFGGVYQYAFFPLDFRGLAHLMFFSSTIKIYGTYIGTDKLGHFTDEGIAYYFEYHKWRDQGASEREAIAHAVRLGTDGVMSESGMLGLASNGDFANGDISANFAGFLFYRNLTEPMRLKGRWYPPMLVRDGPYWKLTVDVRPDGGFFARFISDHLDEALNPGFFDPYLRPAMREAVRAKGAILLQHYSDEEGRPRTRQWFDDKLRELSTYWGIDYGHRGTYDELVSIGDCCFADRRTNPNQQNQTPQLASAKAQASDRRLSPLMLYDAPSAATELHWFHFRTQPPQPRDWQPESAHQHGKVIPAAAVSDVAHVDARDDFGRTLLHEAARAGEESMAQKLLRAGANPNAADDYRITPLHLACRRGSIEITRELIARGANVNAVSAAGTTPLHEAASTGDRELIELLLSHGAENETRDDHGRTPADVARLHGFPSMADVFLVRRPQ
jgi:hypothetical protein